ncbi:SOS response-associated peptidase family protein [Rhizobium leguminosarum]|uniref:SOS response-associated peptidase family protein n=1 Tax=Rhizobium leguminosarum TaxID=384 RepID=UPI003F9500FC
MEFKGKKRSKTIHRFTLVGVPFMAIAAIWRPSRKGQPAAFTMLTTEPGPDVEPVRNRQVVVLHPINWKAWIELTKPEEELLCPLPAGSLSVETTQIRTHSLSQIGRKGAAMNEALAACPIKSEAVDPATR